MAANLTELRYPGVALNQIQILGGENKPPTEWLEVNQKAPHLREAIFAEVTS